MLPWEIPGAISWVLDPTGRALGRYRGGRREGGGLEIWFISGKGGSHGPGECDAGPLLGYGGPLAVLPGMRLCDTCCTRSARYYSTSSWGSFSGDGPLAQLSRHRKDFLQSWRFFVVSIILFFPVSRDWGFYLDRRGVTLKRSPSESALCLTWHLAQRVIAPI